jgi:hypothetical protein
MRLRLREKFHQNIGLRFMTVINPGVAAEDKITPCSFKNMGKRKERKVYI